MTDEIREEKKEEIVNNQGIPSSPAQGNGSNPEKVNVKTAPIQSTPIQTISISKKSLYKYGFILIAFVLIILLFKPFGGASASSINGNAVNVPSNNGQAGGSGEVQLAKMKVVNGEYIITPNSFKAGQKVRITADVSTIPGCAKSVVIRDFGVRQTLSSSNNIIEFTPTKKGTFYITCSMNMYQGTFSVN